jgi:protein required for attachment to host cells
MFVFECELPWTKLRQVTKDGAPNMIGKKRRLMRKLGDKSTKEIPKIVCNHLPRAIVSKEM